MRAARPRSQPLTSRPNRRIAGPMRRPGMASVYASALSSQKPIVPAFRYLQPPTAAAGFPSNHQPGLCRPLFLHPSPSCIADLGTSFPHKPAIPTPPPAFPTLPSAFPTHKLCHLTLCFRSPPFSNTVSRRISPKPALPQFFSDAISHSFPIG